MVTIKLFGMTKSLAGNQETLSLALTTGRQVKDVVQQLDAQYPRIAELIHKKKVLLSVNQDIAHEDTEIRDGDELALLPPFAGGSPTDRPDDTPFVRVQRENFSIDQELDRVKSRSKRIGGIGGRPVVGVLHAVVFFGFLLFAVETVDHFLEGFGVSLLAPLLGGALPAFRAALAAVAVLVILAVGGLAFRRFVLVRTSPDPRSWTSAVVALFIVVLMLTYLNGVRAVPVAPHANWWLHSLVILAFPHLILRSKHFHILLAPVTVFLRGERLGDYPLLDLEGLAEADGDEEVTLGLETLRSVPWKMRLDFLTCVECRRCTHSRTLPPHTCTLLSAGRGGQGRFLRSATGRGVREAAR